MIATGIVRRSDDLRRIVIPKEICQTLRIKEGDPMEFFVNDDEIILKKYTPNQQTFALDCRDFVSKKYEEIVAINYMNDTTAVLFRAGRLVYIKKCAGDIFDMNVALCHAFAKAGYTYKNPVLE